ncbi:hypothetical protein HGA13_12415 [Nocardia speluncae]|uniref:Uncharacterized protein n=1 Tax=Nocardia speluncae TaxID=419477 RepID=A0A846XEP8_9NOCA|nr:hypothetical protein [Nocardia speluncae]NKY33877.1 hypothetical protein [Nocardia speluncae]
MFENCHSPFEVAHVYRGMGFPVSCKFGRVAVTASRSLGAVVMPPDLGTVVRQELEHDHGITASVLTYHRPRRDWVFVVGSGSGGALGEAAGTALRSAGVRVLTAGQQVWLPMSDQPLTWCWIWPPTTAQALPSRSTVLATTRRQLLTERR